MGLHKLTKVKIVCGYAVEDGRRYPLHPTVMCPRCGSRLMLGNPQRDEWHCTNLSWEGDEFMEHYEASLHRERVGVSR